MVGKVAFKRLCISSMVFFDSDKYDLISCSKLPPCDDMLHVAEGSFDTLSDVVISQSDRRHFQYYRIHMLIALYNNAEWRLNPPCVNLL